MRWLAVPLWICVFQGCGTTEYIGNGWPWDDAVTDPGHDPGWDPGPDAVLDPPVDPPFVQGPFSFVLVNPTESPMYVNWAGWGLYTVLGGRSRISGFTPFNWYMPDCSIRCSEIPPGECGCVECEPPEPVVREVPAGASISIPWDPPDVYRFEVDACGCPCVVEEPLILPGAELHYVTAGVESFFSYTCWDECAMDSDGFIHGAYPDGGTMCGLADDFLPVAEDMVIILSGSGCWEDWNSGP